MDLVIDLPNNSDGERIFYATDVANNSEISKRQQKRLAKRQKWLSEKEARRKKEKAKQKRKILEAREKGLMCGPSRKQLKLTKMADSPCKLSVVFDMQFDYLMTDRELSKTIKQLHRCYSMNRRSITPLQLHITSFDNKIEAKMSATSGCLNWDLYFRKKPYTEAFEKERIIYLTSDSPNVIEELDHNKVYVIGGLVDHNRHKGLCYQKAVEKEVYHARLPIDKVLIMKTRTVLTIDQVFLILLHVAEGNKWEEALLNVIPKRKGAELKPLEFVTEDAKNTENSRSVNCNPENSRSINSDNEEISNISCS